MYTSFLLDIYIIDNEKERNKAMKGMQNRYHYIVYGLKVSSEIEIPEFIRNEEVTVPEEEIEIIYGDMPKEVNEAKRVGYKVGLQKKRIWFAIEEVATYMMLDGKRIIVEPDKEHNSKLLRIYILGSALGFIMLQRNHIAIHGSAVQVGDEVAIITGDRGAGKSTLTTAFREKGYLFLTDDVAAITLEDKPVVNSGFPYQKLCEDTMIRMGYSRRVCEYFSRGEEAKYLLDVHEVFQKDKKPLKTIIELGVGDTETVKIEKIKGQEKILHILKNIYRGEYLEKLGGVGEVYFKQCLKIAQVINFYKVTRPRQGFTTDRQLQLIEETLLSV